MTLHFKPNALIAKALSEAKNKTSDTILVMAEDGQLHSIAATTDQLVRLYSLPARKHH